MLKNQRGIAHLGLVILVLAVVGAVGFAGWRVVSKRGGGGAASISIYGSKQETSNEKLLWEGAPDGGWQPIGEVPDCPEPMQFKTPVDISKVTTMLYPGQYRGGEYKAHGGFRFDNSTNDEITVTAPMDGFMVRGARYLASNNIQYVFDFINNCGMTWRFGHLQKMTPELERIAEKFPEPKEGDSRDQSITPPVFIRAGEKIATSVGVTVNGQANTFVDWGVYDLRKTNEAWEKNKTYHDGPGMYWGQKGRHAVCWFDMLPPADAKIVKSLPAADQNSGANSDYCRTY